MSSPLYLTYYITEGLFNTLKEGEMFNGDIVVNKFIDKWQTIHSVQKVSFVIVTRTRGIDLVDLE